MLSWPKDAAEWGWDKISGAASDVGDWFGDKAADEGQYAGVGRGSFDIAGADRRGQDLLQAGRDAYGRSGARMGTPGAFQRQNLALDQMWADRDKGDQATRMRLMNDAEAAAAKSSGAARTMQNQALGQRIANLSGTQARMGAGGQAAMADIMANQNRMQQYLAGAGQLGGQQLQLGSANLGAEMQQRGIGANLLQGMSQLEMQQATNQAQLMRDYEAQRTARAGAMLGTPTNLQAFGNMAVGGLGSLASGGYFNSPKGKA